MTEFKLSGLERVVQNVVNVISGLVDRRAVFLPDEHGMIMMTEDGETSILIPTGRMAGTTNAATMTLPLLNFILAPEAADLLEELVVRYKLKADTVATMAIKRLN